MRKRAGKDDRNARLLELEQTAKAFGDFRPAHSVLTKVRAVSTRFVQFDHATGVRGLPLERFMTVHGPSNGGKAQPVDEPVLTPTGWRPIGELCVGDSIVGKDGLSYRVTGVFPQGERELYRVEFSDGTATETCAEHLWATRTASEWQTGRYVRGPRPERRRISTGGDAPFRVRTLDSIMETLDDLHEVPMVEPVRFDDVGALPIDPYALGLLLGDGCLKYHPTFSKPERDLWDRLAERLPEGDSISADKRGGFVRILGGETRRRLHKLELYGLGSHEKFVPVPYKFASPEDRLALLRGLFDTDGTVTKDGCRIEYSSSSRRLYEDVVEIARGLGAYVSVTARPQPAYTYRGERRIGRPSWRVFVSFMRGEVPIASRKHLAKWNGRRVLRRKRIVAVERSRRAAAVCIRVSAPDRLYVTRDFIVTHNSLFALGLVDSFLVLDHPTLYVDAERTTPITWPEQLMGERARHPFFFAMRPDSYEDTVDTVRKFLLRVKAQRDKGKLPKDTSALVVVDSLKKLLPEKTWTAIIKDSEKNGIDGVGGAAGRLQAAMNSQWLNELTPLLDETGTAFLAIAREYMKGDASPWERKAGRAYVVGGGTPIYYDAAMTMRVERASWVQKEKREEGERADVYGEKHLVTIRKTKVAGHQEKETLCYFHSSNGKFTPFGFDRARDVLELGIKFGIVEQNGAWVSFDGERIGQGMHNAVKVLTDNDLWRAKIEVAVRSHFAEHDPVAIDPETGEVQ